MPAARDPNKLEPAYLITLALILGVPFCCSFLTRNAAKPLKMSIPQRGAWTVKMSDGEGRQTISRVAIQDVKWRVETRSPDNDRCMVVVHDGHRYAANAPEIQPGQHELVNPTKQLQVIASAYNAHPKPESESLDGVLCWHAKARQGDDESETWLDVKRGFPKKFIIRRSGSRTFNFDFDGFSPDAPADPRIFDVNVLDPVFKP